MKHALPLLLLSCILFAQDKPAAVAHKIATDDKTAGAKPKIPPINVRDELIVEISALKEQITRCRGALARNQSYLGDQAIQSSTNNSYFEQARVQYQSNITLLIESQRALLLALAELAKEMERKEPTEAYHSSNLDTGLGR